MTESGPPRFVYGGLFVLLAAPSAGFQWFDGLPFSRAHEFAALVLLAAAIFAGCPTRRDTQPVTSGRVHGFLLALGLCLKLALVLSGQYEGFVACANSPIGGPSTRRCEASYENPFGRFDGATRLDSRIAFDAGAWNLSFLNAERHSVPHWVLGNTDWHRRPIDVAWSGWIDPAPGTALLVSYTGDASLRLGQGVEALPARYGEVATVRVPVAAGRQPIEVLYRFDDDSRIGGVDPKGAYATLRIDTVLERSDVRRPLRSSTVTWIGRAMSVTADVVIVALLANVLIGPFMALSGRGVALLALSLLGALAARSLGTTVGLGGGEPSAPYALATAASVLYVLFSHAARGRHARVVSRLEASLVLAATACGAAAGMTGSIGAVVYQEAGSDWLTYESLARSILETGSLEGGEAVFFYQPLWRYLLFALRLLIGDGHLLLLAAGIAAINWALIMFIEVAPPPHGRRELRKVLWTIGVAILVALANGPTTWAFLLYPSSEFFTWVFLIAAFPALVAGPPAWRGYVLLGACYLLRPNQAVAVAWLMAVATLFAVEQWGRRSGVRTTLTFASIVLAMALLPLTHNLWYGGRAVLTTTSATIPQNLAIDVPTVVRAVTRGDVDPRLQRQLRHAVGWNWAEAKMSSYVAHDVSVLDGFPVLAAAAQGEWLLAVALVLWRVRTTAPHITAALALPLMYLAVHVLYQIDVYYPRHVMAAHFAMLLTAVYAFSRTSLEGERESGCDGRPVRPSRRALEDA